MGFDAMMTIVDLVSKTVHFILTHTTVTTEDVVATTRPVSNSSTSNKSQEWISSGKHELCNSQENSIGNHNNILPTIYINYP